MFPDYFLDEFLSRPGAVPVQPGGGTAAASSARGQDRFFWRGGISLFGDIAGGRRVNLVKFTIFTREENPDGIRQYYYVFSFFLFEFCTSLGIELAFFSCRPSFLD